MSCSPSILLRGNRCQRCPEPRMAANDEVTRLRARCEELEDKVDDLEDENEELLDENRYFEVELAKKESLMVQTGVERDRAEDQLDEKQRELRAAQEDFHRRTLETAGVVIDAAKAARVSPVPGTAGADATQREAAPRLAAPQDLVAFRSDMDVAALLALALQYGRQAKDAELAGNVAAQRERSARALVNRSQEEKNFAICRQMVAMALFDATRQVLYRRTSHIVYATVTGYIRRINAKLPRDAAQLHVQTADNNIKTGWTLIHAHGPTKLNGVEIGRDQLDREKWSIGYRTAPLAELSVLEFVLGNGFEDDLLATLQATGKSVAQLVREAGREVPSRIAKKKGIGKGGSTNEALEARKAEAADLEKQMAAVDSEIDQARRRIAELEERPQPKTPEQVLNSAWASVSDRASAADTVLGKLVSEKNWDEIKETLKMLGRMDVDVSVLTSCGIGRTVNKLKKAEDGDVQTLAKALVKKWKDLVAAQS